MRFLAEWLLVLHSLGDKDNSKSKAEPELSPKKSAALRKTLAQLIKRVYQVDPLICDCGGTLHVISFITEHKVIRKILDHLDKRNGDSRGPRLSSCDYITQSEVPPPSSSFFIDVC